MLCLKEKTFPSRSRRSLVMVPIPSHLFYLRRGGTEITLPKLLVSAVVPNESASSHWPGMSHLSLGLEVFLLIQELLQWLASDSVCASMEWTVVFSNINNGSGNAVWSDQVALLWWFINYPENHSEVRIKFCSYCLQIFACLDEPMMTIYAIGNLSPSRTLTTLVNCDFSVNSCKERYAKCEAHRLTVQDSARVNSQHFI